MRELLGEVADAVAAKDVAGLDGPLEELTAWREWLAVYRFDRRAVNRRLRQYAEGDDGWRGEEGGAPCD